ncbi:MAG: hypothetical protein RPR40_10920 [Bermanella sp.]
MQSTFRLVISALAIVALAACASLPDDASLKRQAQSVSSASKLSSTSFLQRAKLRIQKGKSEALSLYAPSYLENAQNSYRQARAAYADKDSAASIKELTQLSIEYINSGLRTKKLVNNTLKKSLKHRRLLLTLKAHKHFPQAFNDVEAHLLELVRSVEQREPDAALSAQPKLLKEMRALEVKTIGFTHLSKAQEMLSKAQQLDAQELLPKTHRQTLKQLAAARVFIGHNPRQQKQITQITQDSVFASQRLYQLARHAKRLAEMKTDKIEKSVLLHEQQLQRVSRAAQLEDVGNLSFTDQSIVLSEQLSPLGANSKRAASASKPITAKELAKWKRKVVLLKREVKRLHKKLKQQAR